VLAAAFLALNEAGSSSSLDGGTYDSRDNAMMVLAFAPSEYWEIEFLTDGTMDVEIFKSNGKIYDKDVLPKLFEKWKD
jgi:hypothetical protein